MDALAVVVLGAGCLALGGLTAWLGMRLMDAAARLGAAASEREARSAELDRLKRRADADAGRAADAQAELARLTERLAALQQQHKTELESLERVSREKVAAAERVLAESERRLAAAKETFSATAAEALKLSREEFLALAKKAFEAERATGAAELDKRRVAVEHLVQPIAETLKRTDEKLAAMEKERASAYAGLVEQVRSMAQTGEALRGETGKLVRALRDPQVRGAWGNFQLERIAELAGMLPRCHFEREHTTRDADGNVLRPDMIVHQPGGREIVVDAKTNIRAYLESLEAPTPEAAEECLERFARHVSDQVSRLAKKSYWKQYEGSPELVVMFVPGDQFIHAALERRPELWDTAMSQGVVLASPWTLFVLLRAAALLWDERRLGEEAKELRRLGSELHERAAVAFEHVSSLGESIGQAVKRYNLVVGSIEARLMPTLKKFEESGAGSARELPEPPKVAAAARETVALPYGQA